MSSKQKIVKSRKKFAIVRTYGLVHGIAECHDCGKQFQNFKTAQSLSAQHARRYGHCVTGEVGYHFSYKLTK